MIERIYVRNMHCFTDFEWKPGRINLLMGDNGAGKSLLLDLLSGLSKVIHHPDVVVVRMGDEREVAKSAPTVEHGGVEPGDLVALEARLR